MGAVIGDNDGNDLVGTLGDDKIYGNGGVDEIYGNVTKGCIL